MCLAAKEKRDKDAKKNKNSLLLAFFKRPKAALVPSKVGSPAPVHSRKTAPESSSEAGPAAPTTSQPKMPSMSKAVLEPVPVLSGFLKKLQNSITNLPDSVSKASDNDKLAVFGGNPMDLDDPSLDANEFLNQAKQLLGKAAALSDQKQLLLAIASGDVHWVDHLISIGLHQKKGARGLLALVLAAAQGYYHPKSFTEEEDMRAVLLWRLSGNRVAEINHCSQGAPSVSYLRTRSTVPPIIPSHGRPTMEQVQNNVDETLESVLDVIHSRLSGKVLHNVVMFDELATEKRIRWDPKTNYFLGVCRQHAHKASIEFVNEGDLEELFQHIGDGEVHYAAEATVGALGILCKDNHIYPGRPVLVFGDCKRKTGKQHANIIQTVLDGINALQEKTKLRTVSVASNGETQRGSSFILLTFKRQLSSQSPIYPILQPLKFLNLHVGNNDLTCDKDWKHIEHLSAAAHLALALYKLAGKDFIPTNLYINLNIMIKNVLFCVAKAKIDDPDGELWIILLRTDRLEELFGILRTMVGNDTNLDILQLVCCLAGTTEVSNILAKYPHWNRSPQRLKLPALSQESKEIPDSAYHIKPTSWRGNIKNKDVSLQTLWNCGRHLVEQDCEILKPILCELDAAEGINILLPFGTLLFNVPLAEDDINKSLKDPSPEPTNMAPHHPGSDSADIDTTRVKVEDALGELTSADSAAIEPQVHVIEGKIMHAGLMDQLRRVQEVKQYVINKVLDSPAHGTPSAPPAEVLVVSDPIATLFSSDNKAWLCIGEVNSLKIDGQSADTVTFDMLSENTVTVSYQMLGLRPANIDDNPEAKHDWRTYRMDKQLFTVPGRLIQPINPALSKTHIHIPFYLFQSTVLVALTASLFQSLMSSHLKGVPKLAPTKEFPYREASALPPWCFCLKLPSTPLPTPLAVAQTWRGQGNDKGSSIADAAAAQTRRVVSDNKGSSISAAAVA
ncbi:hypothetical protein B0H34DRAFT_798966 [Crassisporium funariophilum]|nr:hypothetical protein B0H34DRAFT_798966 [Crassisporium funariophilum]